MQPIIEVSGLGKRYLLDHAAAPRPNSLREALAMSAGDALRRVLGRSRAEEREVFWALKDISFAARRGERLGIIGRNGAGKSTLLKLLSRISTPSQGRITLRGRVASLLEVGTGFHSELTGRENIYMNGAILGMRRGEIRAKFDAIVAFSEVEKFLDTPVKRYSSGMHMRLAFAVAAHLEPEILIVDEVLAVGDAAFQKKCLGKMREVGEEGRTILFVSHSMGAVSSLCQRALLLEGGRIKMDGPVADVCSAYSAAAAGSARLEPRQFKGSLAPALRFTRLSVNQGRPLLQPSEDVEVVAEGECLREIPGCRLQMSVFKGDVRLLTQQDCPAPRALPAGRFRCRFVLPSRLLRPGEFSLSLGAITEAREALWGSDLLFFRIGEAWDADYDRAGEGLINLLGHGARETW